MCRLETARVGVPITGAIFSFANRAGKRQRPEKTQFLRIVKMGNRDPRFYRTFTRCIADCRACAASPTCQRGAHPGEGTSLNYRTFALAHRIPRTARDADASPDSLKRYRTVNAARAAIAQGPRFASGDQVISMISKRFGPRRRSTRTTSPMRDFSSASPRGDSGVTSMTSLSRDPLAAPTSR